MQASDKKLRSILYELRYNLLVVNVIKIVIYLQRHYLQSKCFKRCDWISYLQLQPIIKQRLSLSFRNELFQGFMGNGVNQKILKKSRVNHIALAIFWEDELLQISELVHLKFVGEILNDK